MSQIEALKAVNAETPLRRMLRHALVSAERHNASPTALVAAPKATAPTAIPPRPHIFNPSTQPHQSHQFHRQQNRSLSRRRRKSHGRPRGQGGYNGGGQMHDFSRPTLQTAPLPIPHSQFPLSFVPWPK